MTPWGASSSAKDESGVCLCVLVRIVHWVVLRFEGAVQGECGVVV